MTTNDDIAASACALSKWIDGSYPPDLDPETVLWRRVSKVSSEANEARDALEGYVGENPRKGVTHTLEDVIGELLDTALCALAAVEHITGNNGHSMSLLADKAQRVVTRAGLGEACSAVNAAYGAQCQRRILLGVHPGRHHATLPWRELEWSDA